MSIKDEEIFFLEGERPHYTCRKNMHRIDRKSLKWKLWVPVLFLLGIIATVAIKTNKRKDPKKK